MKITGIVKEVKPGTDELTGANIATIVVGNQVHDINIGTKSFALGEEVEINTTTKRFGLATITESQVSLVRQLELRIRQQPRRREMA